MCEQLIGFSVIRSVVVFLLIYSSAQEGKEAFMEFK